MALTPDEQQRMIAEEKARRLTRARHEAGAIGHPAPSGANTQAPNAFEPLVFWLRCFCAVLIIAFVWKFAPILPAVTQDAFVNSPLFEHSSLRLALLMVALVSAAFAAAGLVTNIVKFSERGVLDSLARIVLGLGIGILTLTLAVSVGRVLPHIGKTRIHAKEAGAVSAIRTLNRAQRQYQETFNSFADSLGELGPPASGPANASAANLISADLASGERNGYRFVLEGAPSWYSISAVPVVFGSSGVRTFYSDQSLVIRQNEGHEPATASSAAIGDM